MRSSTAFICLAAALGGLVSRQATAEVKPTLGGSSRAICADSNTKHPTRAQMTTVITDDRFESSETIVLAAFYEPHPATEGPRGKVTAKTRLFKADGSEKALKTLKQRLPAANKFVLITKSARAKLEEGDVIQWDFKLRGFPELPGGRCFDLAALVGSEEPPDLGEGEVE